MNRTAVQPEPSANGDALHWPGRVVTAQALERRLNGARRLVLPSNAVVTPLAQEYLRAGGVTVERQPATGPKPAPAGRWGLVQEREDPLVASAVQALARDGVVLQPLAPQASRNRGAWARQVAACVATGECCGGIVFCSEPGLVCCVGNKVTGLRAVAVGTVQQAVLALMSVGANLLAVEMPGRTFFEIKQILRLACNGGAPRCPDDTACTLRELDGHAHR